MTLFSRIKSLFNPQPANNNQNYATVTNTNNTDDSDDSDSSLVFRNNENWDEPKFIPRLPSEELKKGVQLTGDERLDVHFPNEIQDIMLDIFMEPGILRIISLYSGKFYRCVHCHKVFDEGSIIFYNRGHDNIITECFRCS